VRCEVGIPVKPNAKSRMNPSGIQDDLEHHRSACVGIRG
jgi:hypothetical protein